jgi:hypothetical protein
MKYIIVTGNPVNGFGYIGPFVDRDDAVRYSDCLMDLDWWVAEVNPPELESGELTQADVMAVIQPLRDAGYAVCAFNPDEIGSTDREKLEQRMCAEGWDFIQENDE